MSIIDETRYKFMKQQLEGLKTQEERREDFLAAREQMQQRFRQMEEAYKGNTAARVPRQVKMADEQDYSWG